MVTDHELEMKPISTTYINAIHTKSLNAFIRIHTYPRTHPTPERQLRRSKGNRTGMKEKKNKMGQGWWWGVSLHSKSSWAEKRELQHQESKTQKPRKLSQALPKAFHHHGNRSAATESRRDSLKYKHGVISGPQNPTCY